MPRAKPDQLTAEQREHVAMVEASLIREGVPEKEAHRQARLTVSEAPSRRHNPNEKNAALGSQFARHAGRARPTTGTTLRTTEAAKRRTKKLGTGAAAPTRVPVRVRPPGRT